MKIIFKIIILISTLLLTQTLLASNIVATVNKSNITQNDVDKFVNLQRLGSSFYLLSPEQQKAVINKLIDSKLFLEDAKKMHIDTTKEFIEALKREKEKLMLDFWMKKKVEEIKISNREAKIYYRDNIEKFYQPASVKVRHILLTSEYKAKSIINQLKRNRGNLKEKFIVLAKKESTGPSAINGGELDWFIKEQMVPEFSEAAFSLSKGRITTEPIKTQFGYHVIYLEDKKEQGTIAFKTVKNDIIKVLRGLKFKAKLVKLSKRMRDSAHIEFKR